jgi:hypothetical protein
MTPSRRAGAGIDLSDFARAAQDAETNDTANSNSKYKSAR